MSLNLLWWSGCRKYVQGIIKTCPAVGLLLTCRCYTCAEGEELAQQAQQVQDHEAFREGSSGK